MSVGSVTTWALEPLRHGPEGGEKLDRQQRLYDKSHAAAHDLDEAEVGKDLAHAELVEGNRSRPPTACSGRSSARPRNVSGMPQ